MDKQRDGFPLTSVREINILLSLRHENIVNVSEVVVGSSLDSIFMVMEYVEHDLKDLMRSQAVRAFSVPQVRCRQTVFLSSGAGAVCPLAPLCSVGRCCLRRLPSARLAALQRCAAYHLCAAARTPTTLQSSGCCRQERCSLAACSQGCCLL
jgi:hypothetical protein